MEIKGAVVVPGEKEEPLRLLPPRESIEHNPDSWAKCMGWDLLTGTVLGDFNINKYDVVLINGNTETLELVAEIKTSFKGKIIFLIEGSASALSYEKTRIKIKYIQTLKLVDAIGTLDYNFSWYRLFTQKPVFWLGVPFPVAEVKKYSIPIRERKHIWAMGSNINSHNTLGSLFVAKQAGVEKVAIQEFPEDNLIEFCQQLGIDFVERHKPLPWINFLEKYRYCWGGIILTNEYTWGRLPLDFAALGIPVVGSVRQFTQKILFPSLSFEPYLESSKAVSAIRKLEKDLDYYKFIINYAQRQLRLFTHEAAQERMECLLKEIL